MGDKPTKHSERDTVVKGLNLLDIPHSIIHVILRYLDKKSLVAVSQSCQTLKLVSYSSNLWRNDVLDLSIKSLRKVTELTIHSLVERRISTLKVVDAYTDDNSKEASKNHKHSNEAQHVKQLIPQFQTIMGDNVKTLLWSIGSQSKMDISMLTQFTSLTSLVLVHTVQVKAFKEMHVKLNEVLAVLVNLERLVLLVGVDACTNTSWAEDSRAKENEFSYENYLTKVTNSLPKLRDVTLGKMFWGYYSMREIGLAGIKYNSELPPPPEIIGENVMRLSMNEGLLGAIGMHHLSKFFPNVPHLVLLHPREHSYQHDVRSTHTQLPALLDSFCFLESLELGDIGRIEGDSIPLIPPNVKALKLRGCLGKGLTSTMSISTLLSRAATNLTVLEIAVPKLLEPEYYFDDNADKHKILSNLCQAIRELPKLETLIMSRVQILYNGCYSALIDMGDEFNFCIQEQAKSLKSVIGVELPCRSLLPPNLRFITTACGEGDDPLRPVLLQRSQSYLADWKTVSENSIDWHIAHGTAQFYTDGQVTKQNEIVETFVQRETRSRRRHFVSIYAKTADFPRFHDYEMYW